MKTAPRSRRTVLVLLGVLALFGMAGVAVAANAKPDFTLQLSPSSQSVQQGQPAAYTVTTTATGGFIGSVAFTVSGLPSGATAVFTPVSSALSSTAATGTSSVVISTTGGTPVGSYDLTIMGTSGNKKNALPAKLTVTRALNGSFTVGAAPAAVTLTPGSTAVYTVTVGRTGSFTGSVDLAPYGSWPSGVTPMLSPRTLPGSATGSTLEVSTTAGVPTGSYTLYLVGSATVGGTPTYQYAQVELVVDKSKRSFTISGGSPAKPLAPGIGTQPLDLTLSNPDAKAISVTNLSVTVTGTSNPACAVSNYAVTQYVGPYPLTVPGGGQKVTLSDLGVPAGQLPQLRMLDLPTNQDVCKGVVVTLSFSGSAQGA